MGWTTLAFGRGSSSYAQGTDLNSKDRHLKEPIQLTEEEIEAGRTPKGGYTRAQLQAWGVPWPPPKGWRDCLIAGVEVKEVIQREKTVDDLLHEVVMIMVESGHAYLLYDSPDVLEYFGAKTPDEPAPAYGPATEFFFNPKPRA